ncbi:hypothetical protein [Solicola sp. PLA-1-18]|uniref:hypothetical protein n=1 Tax=Solicola sp. PLA-1-18 TaxID=3380532 RepID=UPI003B7AE883
MRPLIDTQLPPDVFVARLLIALEDLSGSDAREATRMLENLCVWLLAAIHDYTEGATLDEMATRGCGAGPLTAEEKLGLLLTAARMSWTRDPAGSYGDPASTSHRITLATICASQLEQTQHPEAVLEGWARAVADEDAVSPVSPSEHTVLLDELCTRLETAAVAPPSADDASLLVEWVTTASADRQWRSVLACADLLRDVVEHDLHRQARRDLVDAVDDYADATGTGASDRLSCVLWISRALWTDPREWLPQHPGAPAESLVRGAVFGAIVALRDLDHPGWALGHWRTEERAHGDDEEQP